MICWTMGLCQSSGSIKQSKGLSPQRLHRGLHCFLHASCLQNSQSKHNRSSLHRASHFHPLTSCHFSNLPKFTRLPLSSCLLAYDKFARRRPPPAAYLFQPRPRLRLLSFYNHHQNLLLQRLQHTTRFIEYYLQ